MVENDRGSQPVQVYRIATWKIEKMELRGPEHPVEVGQVAPFNIEIWLTSSHEPRETYGSNFDDVEEDGLAKSNLAATTVAKFSPGGELESSLSFSCLFQNNDRLVYGAQSSRIAPTHSLRRRLSSERDSSSQERHYRNRNARKPFVSGSPRVRDHSATPTARGEEATSAKNYRDQFSSRHQYQHRPDNLLKYTQRIGCSANLTFLKDGIYEVGASLWTRGSGTTGRFGWKESLPSRKVTARLVSLSPRDILLTARPKRRNEATPKCVPTLPRFAAGGIPDASVWEEEIRLYSAIPYDLVATLKTLRGAQRVQWSLFIDPETEEGVREERSKLQRATRKEPRSSNAGPSRINRETNETHLLEYVFEKEGVYALQLNVTTFNQFVARNFTLIIIDHRLENPLFTLSPKSSDRPKPNSDVEFILSIRTTVIEDSSVSVNFGDGVIWNETLSNVIHGRVNRTVLISSDYGRDCRFTSKIRHRYRTEGIYYPTVIAFTINDQLNILEGHLDKYFKVSVCESLEGSVISGNHLIPVGTSTSFILSTNRDSKCPKTERWTLKLEDGINENIIDHKIDHGSVWEISLNETGNYVVESNIDNVVSSSSAIYRFKVIEPVGNVSLSYKPGLQNGCVKIWDTVRVVSFWRGTDVTCTWNVYDSDGHTSPEVFDEVVNCTTKLTFDKPDVYRVCIEIRNIYNHEELCHQLTVQEEIKILELFTDVIGGNVEVYGAVDVRQSNGIEIVVRLSNGHIRELILNDTKFSTVFQLTTSLPLKLSVRASNNVTHVLVNRTIHDVMTSKETIPYFRIEPLGCVIVGQQSFLKVAFNDDEISYSGKMSYVYKWGVSGYGRTVTSLPFYSFVPTSEDVLNVRVSVAIGGDEKRNRTKIKVEPETNSGLCVWNQPIVQPGTNVTFNILKPPGNVTGLFISLENLTSGEAIVEAQLPVTEKRVEKWFGTLYSPGLVLVRVGCFSATEGRQLNQSSLSLVQDHVTPALIHGPQRILFSRVPVKESWEAITPTSVGVVYKWKLDDEPEVSRTSPKFSARFISPGNHSLRVKVRDSFGAGQAWLSSALVIIVARQLPFDLKLEYSRQEGRDWGKFNFILTIEGGSSRFVVHFKFGDGTSRKIVSETRPLGTPDPLQFVTKTYHHYRRRGLYHVVVNVSYPIADEKRCVSRDARLLVMREEPVGASTSRIRFQIRSPSLVALFQNVVVVATITGGTTVFPKIDWDFGDGTEGEFTKIETVGNECKATHSYGKWGNYTVKASIKSDGQRSVVLVKPKIIVLEPIQRLKINSKQRVIIPSENVTFEVQFGWGSDVTFNVSFDDGTFILEKPQINPFPVTLSLFTHRYHQGVFRPNVLASNSLGSVRAYLNQELRVQSPPTDLKLQNYYVSKKNRPIEIEAKILSGSNVSYDWFLGDSFWKTTVGSKVNPSFPLTGMYRVAVEAYNDVTDLGADGRVNRAETRVYVLDVLRDVRICLIGEDASETCESELELVLPLEEKIVFKARVNPETEKILQVTWKVGNVLKNSASTRLEHKFKDAGRYSINVTVNNIVSKMSSGFLKIFLIQRLQNLTNIKHDGTVLKGEITVFHALFWHGSDLRFSWDFGDGSDVEEGTSVSKHAFLETGEYFVTVTAWNQFSRANFTTNVFALDKPCSKPVLEIIEQCRNQEIHSSEPLEIEIDLSVTCQGLFPVSFHWSIADVHNRPMVLPENLAFKRNLYLAPEFLQPGTYKVMVKVSIPDTIVYAEVFTEVRVQPQSLVARIEGGLSRRFGILDKIVFDSSESRIPCGNITDLEFKWSCRPLRIQSASCFVVDYEFKSVNNFTIAAKEFNLADNAYLISLTIRTNQETSDTSTVIEISNNEMNLLKVRVTGMNYDGNEISESLPVKIEAKCDGCENFEYEWKMWLVEDGFQYQKPDIYDCAYSEGTAHNLIENEILPTIFDSLNANITSIDDHLDVLLPQFPNFTLFSEYNSTKSKRDTRSKVKSSANEKSNGRKTTVYSLNNYPVEDFPYDLSKSKTQDYQLPPHLNVTEEGSPGEGGSARAREHTNIDRPLDKAGDGSGEKKQDPRKEVRDDTIEPETEPHILHRPRVPLHFYRNETTTGLNSKYLVIKEEVLAPFRTYIVSVSVRDPVSGQYGAAMDYFKIVPGPGEGRCSVAPVEGIALETTFRLHCLEWKSERRPLTYVIHYSLDANGPRYPLSSGFNPNAKFFLPPGIESRNYTLTLHLKIKDSFGSITEVCTIDTRVVKPSSGGEFISDDRVKKLIRERNIQGVLGYLLIFAQNSSSPSLIKDGLKLLKGVEPDTPFESIQCLTILTAFVKNRQLIADQLEMVTELVSDSVAFLSNYFRDLDVHVPILNAIFTILNSTTSSDSSMDWRLQDSYYNTRERLLELMDNLTNFKALLVVEDPVELSIPELGMSYGYVRSSKLPIPMNVGPVKLTYLDLNENNTCDQSIAVNKYFNLTIFGSYSGLPVKRVIVSTITNTCTYDKSSSEFTAEFPRNVTTENVRVLRNGFINVHRFNLTSELVNESLTITVHILNELENPLVIMLGLSSDIGPRSQLVLKTLTHGFGSLSLFIPAGLIKRDSRPRVIIAPAKYANGEIEGETAEAVKYRITVLSQICLTRVEDAWTSNEDCRVMDSTDERRVICGCVTSYPVGLVTWSASLVFAEEVVEDILGSYYNPTALISFAIIVFVYVILLRKTFSLDQRNTQHCLLNELKDNKPYDSYYYFVSIRTGPFLEAGTTASVYLVLHGDEGYSSAKCLSTSVTFQRSSRDNFFIGVEKCLGKIWKAQLWHNNAGTSPSWYLQDLTVVDLLNEKQYRFNCEKWLSVEEEDGLVERELLSEETDPPFSKIFRETLSYVLPNHHLWSSVFSAPSWSVFNHSQRLTCCLSTIFASSALCALGTDYLRLSCREIVAGIPWKGLALAGVVSIVSFVFHSQLISATRHARYRRPSLFVRCRAPLVDCLWCSWWWCWLRAKRTSQRGSGRSSSPSILMDEIMDSDSEYREGTMTETDSDRSEDFEEGIELAQYPKRNYRYHSSGTSLHLRSSSDVTRERNISEISSQRSGQTSSGFEDWLPECQDDTSPVLERVSDKYDDHKRLPRYFLYVSWIALVIVIVSSSVVTLRQINRFDTIRVFFWLSSWCFALMFDVVIWQPLMVLVISFVASLTAYRAKENWTMDCWSKALKLATKKAKEIRIYEGSFPFSKSRNLTYNRPPSEYDLILARQKAARFRATSLFIKNALWSIFMGVFLVILIIGDPPSDYFELRQSISSYVERFLMNDFKNYSDWNNWYLTNFSKFVEEFRTSTNCEVVGAALITPNTSINFSTIDFLFFNPATSLFSYVSLKQFFPASISSLSFKLDVSVARLKETESNDLFSYFLEVIFVVITFWLLKLETWRFFKKRGTYWKNISNLMKILFCVTGCVYFSTLIYQSYTTESIFLALKNGKLKNLVDIRPLAFCDWLRRSLRGALLYIHVLNCFAFLKFHRIFEKFVKAIVSVWKLLVSLMFVWCFFLTGVIMVQKLMLGVEDGSHVTSVVNLINSKRQKLRNDHRSVLASVFYALTISITFFVFGFTRAAMVTALRRSKGTGRRGVFSKNVAKNVIGRILCKDRFNSVSRIENTKLPLEFLLFELDTVVNELIEKANKLFSTSESDLRVEMEENIRDIICDFERWKDYSFEKSRRKNVNSFSDIDYPFSSVARQPATWNHSESRAIYKIRKTYPIQISNSLDHGSESSSSDLPLEFEERDSNAHIRKTKSKGKGKNGTLHVALENLTNSSES